MFVGSACFEQGVPVSCYFFYVNFAHGSFDIMFFVTVNSAPVVCVGHLSI
jgi:hypothetical protein